MQRTDRLFSLLLTLQAHGTMRARDLAAEAGVSLRTIYRDLQALQESGAIIDTQLGQGYSLAEDVFLTPLMLTSLEAGALAAALRLVTLGADSPLRAAAASAQAKLALLLAVEQLQTTEQLQRSLFCLQQPAQPAHESLRPLRESISRRHAVWISYRAFGRPAAEAHLIEPIGFVHVGGNWHLLAQSGTEHSPRSYRLDRIEAVQPTPSTTQD